MRPKIVGALIVGLGLIALGYYFSPLQQARTTAERAQLDNTTDQAQEVVATTTQPRESRAVSNTDADGEQDWRTQFQQIVSPEMDGQTVAESYTPPDTLTGQFGVDIFKQTIELKANGSLYEEGPAVVNSAIEDITQKAQDRLYGSRDITITSAGELSLEAERTYFNSVADIISRNNTDTRNEAEILQDALDANDPEILEELEQNEAYYKALRDELLRLPAPSLYAKQHLDLINAAHAIYNDIIGMQLTFEDPLSALLRVKRYQNDTAGLFHALQNYFFAIEESPVIFTENDAAYLFVAFAPNQ